MRHCTTIAEPWPICCVFALFLAHKLCMFRPACGYKSAVCHACSCECAAMHGDRTTCILNIEFQSTKSHRDVSNYRESAMYGECTTCILNFDFQSARSHGDVSNYRDYHNFNYLAAEMFVRWFHARPQRHIFHDISKFETKIHQFRI